MPVHSVQRLQRLQKMTENEWRPNFLADEGEVCEDPEIFSVLLKADDCEMEEGKE